MHAGPAFDIGAFDDGRYLGAEKLDPMLVACRVMPGVAYRPFGVVANLIDPAGCYRTAPCPHSWAKG